MASEKKKDFENITEDNPESIAIYLEVLSNPLRRKIIQCLAREDSYMAALAEEVKSTPQALVKHLKLLEKRGIIRSQEGANEVTLRVRAQRLKKDNKIKYYSLNQNVNLKINFGLGYYELSGHSWLTNEMKENRDKARERYQELLEEFSNLEDYIKSQLDESISADESLNKMNEILESFSDLEKFLLIQRQIIMIRKLKQAVGILSGESAQKLRPLFFDLLHALDLDDEKFKAFEKKVRELLPAPEADQLLKITERSSLTTVK